METPSAESSTGRTRLSVHRCRFVDWTPSEITAIAFAPLAPPNSSASRSKASRYNDRNASGYGVMAVGRANGTIELCEWSRPDSDGVASQGWTARKVLAGPNPSKVDSLAFAIKDPFDHPTGTAPGPEHLRLFSTTAGKDLLEWDLVSGMIKRVVDSNGGAIWSIAVNSTSTSLALGCDDGSVRIFSLSSDDELIPLRPLDRVKSRILSLAWGPPRFVPKPTPSGSATSDSDSDDDDDEERWKDGFIVAGCSDSSVRKWDVSTGRVLERMTTDQLRGEKTLVWSVGVLLDGTVVTGDSLGCVKFWDPMTSTQIHSFQAHNADVLCLTVGPDFRSVYASGVDQRISEFALVDVVSTDSPSDPTSSSSSRPQWIHTRSRRIHAHDVRSIAIWPSAQLFPRKLLRSGSNSIQHSRNAPILVSGGSDMCLTVSAVSPPSSTTTTQQQPPLNPFARGAAPSFEDTFYRKMSFSALGSSGGRVVQVAAQARFVLCRFDTKISIWLILPERGPGRGEGGDAGWQKLLDMDLKVDTTLVSSAISPDGRWLAVSDAYETKLFRLISEMKGGALRLKPKRVKRFSPVLQEHVATSLGTRYSPSSSLGAASSLVFTPDSSRLVVASSGLLILFDLVETATEAGRTAYDARIIRSFAQHRTHRGGNAESSRRFIKPLPIREQPLPEPKADAAEASSSDSDSDSDSPSPSTSSSEHISHLAVSPDGQWLASSSLNAHTHVFNLDTVKHHCTLPSSTLPPTSVTFDSHPSFAHILVLTFPNNSVLVYDVEKREFPSWARGVNAKLPFGLERLNDPIAGICFVHGDTVAAGGGTGTGTSISGETTASVRGGGSRRSTSLGSTAVGVVVDRHTPHDALVWGKGWMCKVDLAGEGGDATATGPGLGALEKIRKRNHRDVDESSQARGAPKSSPATSAEKERTGGETQRPAQVVTKYRDILLVDSLGPSELIVVERPIIDVLQTLRPAYYKPKYGSK